ncbi:MAG TPA: (d)CMP kinase [Cytophagales bacterium]|nr:(d)CMP kinase [Cytophagales bacterium]HAA17990.1 (d)CMP kinase [Cytophagales bacterium]HAP64735.1 (d)CMP kinase [Cytophagales bacterium]
MRKIVIALDGYSACGKSSTAKELARRLEYGYIDTGAMYRAVTHYFQEHNVSLSNPKEVEKALLNIEITFICHPQTGDNETFLNGLRVEDVIRSPKVSGQVSEVSTLKVVREAMVAQQRKMGKKKGIVMDGRDIGTVVFPDAELKVFMTADMEVRVGRRQKELLEKGQMVSLEEVRENLEKRDLIDTTREESPLRKADDAFVIDTTNIIFDQQVEQILNLANDKMIEHHHGEDIGL